MSGGGGGGKPMGLSLHTGYKKGLCFCLESIRKLQCILKLSQRGFSLTSVWKIG